MSDRLSRSERRALMKREAAQLAQPLALTNDPRPVAVHVRHVVRLLRDPQAKSPCSDAVAHLTALFDRSVPKADTAMLACRKGCAHCCTQMVVVTAPEAFYVAAQIRDKPAVVNAVIEAAQKTGKLSLDARLTAEIMCPLLDGALCSVYTHRPLGCHGFVSANLEACFDAFTRGQTPNIPMPADTVSILYACRMLFAAALRLAGVGAAIYELNSALAAILTQENAEARWLSGENILAGIKPEPPPPPQFEHAIRQMAAFVAPTI